MLVQLTKLPVDGEDVHVVVLLEVMGQQVQGVLASLQPLLILMDLLHLDQDTKQMFLHQKAGRRNFFAGVYVDCPKHPHRVFFLKAVKHTHGPSSLSIFVTSKWKVRRKGICSALTAEEVSDSGNTMRKTLKKKKILIGGWR